MRSTPSAEHARWQVPPAQLEPAPQHAAAPVDLVDRHAQPARNGFAGTRRLPGQRRHQPDLDGLRPGSGRRKAKDGENCKLLHVDLPDGWISLAGRMPCYASSMDRPARIVEKYLRLEETMVYRR
jgi:hypothetical protein